jgi:hypothetical protein
MACDNTIVVICNRSSVNIFMSPVFPAPQRMEIVPTRIIHLFLLSMAATTHNTPVEIL